MKSRIAAATLASAVLFACPASARDQIRIAGSSTVLPYAQIVAEIFGESYPQFPTPIVESGGSSGGLKEFCQGVGSGTIDIANASRPIREREREACAKKGVTEIIEVRFGYDGIVFATAPGSPDFALTPTNVYLALAANVMVDGVPAPNPNMTWNDADPNLPSWRINAYIPGEKHGTREVLEEKTLAVGCEATGAMDAMIASGIARSQAKAACARVRNDGASVDIDGDYTETLARIDANRTGVGAFGFSFYENNRDKLKLATMSGVFPTTETIASGEYPVSRPLFFYVKAAHLDAIPGLRSYVEFFARDEMIGPESPLAEYGLIPAPKSERQALRAHIAAGEAQ